MFGEKRRTRINLFSHTTSTEHRYTSDRPIHRQRRAQRATTSSTRFFCCSLVDTASQSESSTAYRLFPFHALYELLMVQVWVLSAFLDQLGQLVLEPVGRTGQDKQGSIFFRSGYKWKFPSITNTLTNKKHRRLLTSRPIG